MASVSVGGAVLETVFGELLEAVIETKNEAVGFSSILNRLEVTIKSVFAIIMEKDELKKEVDHPKEELEGLIRELNKGVEVVRKCSKVSRLNLYRRTKYTTKLRELDGYIIIFFNIHAEVDRTTEQMLQPSDLAEMTESSINRIEEGHPFVMQSHSGMTEPPNDGELVKDGSRLVLLQAGLGLTVPPKEEEWEEAEEIHLMDNEISELPKRPVCSMLSELYLQGNYKLRKIPSSFFEHMPALQVLNLSKTGIRSLPESLFRLVGLKKLFLNGCENFMMLSPKVGELEHLEVLNLEGTEIIDLPKEVKKLTSLKCLKVSFYGYINRGRKNEQSNAMIHAGVISTLSKLEELNIDVNPDDERWGISVEAIIDEIHSLMQLRTLKFYFPGVELLRQFKWFPAQPSLSNFRFIVGHHSKRIISRLPQDAEFELKNWDRCLTYIYGEGVPEEIKKLLPYATAFHLDRHMTVKKLSEFGIENMEQLKCCIVGECKEIQVIIDGEDVHEEDHNREIAPESSSDKIIGLEALEYLNIYYMKNLRSIWKGPVHGRSLSLLKSLTLSACPELTTIFTLFFLDNLYSLEELTIEDCPTIKSLISCENCSKHKSSSSTRDYFLPKLKKISLYFVPELVSISNGVCIAPKLEWLAFYNCPNLKSLYIEEVCSTYLEMIVGEKDWWDALEWRNGRPDNLDGIFVPISADNLTNAMDDCHSLFLSPSHALKQKWSPSQQQGQDRERMTGAGNRWESMGKEMKQQKPPARGNIKTGFSVSTGGTDLSSMASKASSFSLPSSEGEILPSTNVKSFSFAELKSATRNFRRDSVLGEGGFGSVFKGWIDEHSFAAANPGTGMAIAVKRLNQDSFQGHKEWLAEINYLGQLYHPHLVKLIGYCLEDEHRLLVYEFMPHGSLENHLFRRGSYFKPLSWDLRLKVALGAAKGLAFLHSAEAKVIYRDFKASNILLDSNYNAKLSDFGLAKDGPTGTNTHVSTRVMGTSGYAAPEYVATGHLSCKSDVYSFGVVLLEMLSGRRAIDKNRPSGEHLLVEWAKPYLTNKQNFFRVMDTRLDGQYKLAGARKAAKLALRCLSVEPKYRPTMDEIVTALEELQDSR